MGRAAYARGDHERTAALVQESLTLFKDLGDLVGCAYAYWYLGNVATDRGEYACSGRHAPRAEPLPRPAGG